MPTVTRTFPVAAPPSAVVAYLADFGNAEKWDPGTQSCTRIDDGPLAVGAQWRNVSKLMGATTELTYTLKELTDDTVKFEGVNKASTSTDHLTVRPHGEGSEITYRAVIDLHGAWKLTDPLMKLFFERIAGEVVDNLTGELGAP